MRGHRIRLQNRRLNSTSCFRTPENGRPKRPSALEHRAALRPWRSALWLSSVFSWANLVLLIKSVVFLEIAIVIFAMLVMRLCTRVLAAPPLNLAKNSCLTPFGISSSGNTRGVGGITLVLSALAAMQWTAPKSACAASPQPAPIKTLDSARQNGAQASAGGRNSSELPSRLDPILAEARSLADRGMTSEAERRVRQYLAVHPDS